MAGMAANAPYALASMLKAGHQHFAGMDEAVMRNIEAAKAMAQITRTSLGPNGMNKMVINHLERLFVTSDASTIVTELEINHPAARLLVHAAKAQEAEVGDATNLVLALGGELLGGAEGLLRDGLHTAEVANGYYKASQKALEILETLILPGSETLDIRNKQQVAQRLQGTISSRINGYEGVLSQLVAEACIDVLPKNPTNFNVDNVRVVKIPGGGMMDSNVVKGMVFRRDTEGTVKVADDAKVAVFAQGVDTATTDTKGTVLIKTAEELENYSKSEEAQLEGYIKSIADAGVKVVVSGTTVGEMALHFLEKYEIMVLRLASKFDLLRLCKSTGATARSTFGTPSPDEIGFVKRMSVQELGGANCCVLQQDAALGTISTICVRASTEGFVDDVERAINNAVNAFKALTRDARCLAAGGAPEMELARQLQAWSKTQTGLEQYSITKFAEAFEVVPRTLAENSGLDATAIISELYAAHARGETNTGVDVEGGPPKDLTQDSILDVYMAKWWAIRLATEAATTILKVDQIIMSKQAGGPKPRGPGMDED